MTCLAGTVEDPRPWYRYRPDGSSEKIEGRWCARTSPRTSRRKCSSCPAFRGIRWDGAIANGLVRDDPVGLSAAEHASYQHAMNEAFIEDNFLPLRVWLDAQARELVIVNGKRSIIRGIGLRGRRAIGDPEALELEAKRMTGYRASHPDYAKANRERTKERMRQLRQARKAVCMPLLYEGPIPRKVIHVESDTSGNHTRSRARA